MNKIELRSLLSGGGQDTPASRIVRMLTERGSLSAAQLSKLTGLAKSTVSVALAELRRTDMVVEVSTESDGTVGRPARTLSLNPEAGTCIGILIGQTEIQVIVADVAHTILADRTVEVEEDYDPAMAGS